MNWLRRFFVAPAYDVRLLELEARPKAEPHPAYVTVTIEAAYLPFTRRGLKRFHPVLVGSVSSSGFLVEGQTYRRVIRPDHFSGLGEPDSGKVFLRGREILKEVAHNGGSLTIEVALIALERGPVAEPFLSLLQEVDQAGGGAITELVVPYAPLVRKGVELLKGVGGETSLELGVDHTLPVIGDWTIAVVRVDKKERTQLEAGTELREGRLVFSDDTAIVRSAYVVYRLRGTPHKSDWHRVPSLARAYDLLTEAIKMREILTVEATWISFERIVRTCQDILPSDRSRLLSEVREAVYLPAVSDTLTGGVAEELPSLSSFLR